MREAKILLDITRSEGGEMRLRNGKPWLEALDKICGVFGGYTAHPSQGCWHDPKSGMLELDVSVAVYIAMEPTFENEVKLRQLAVDLAQGQKVVYVVSAVGAVMLLDVIHEPVKDWTPPPHNMKMPDDFLSSTGEV